jgi:hypothetical protein
MTRRRKRDPGIEARVHPRPVQLQTRAAPTPANLPCLPIPLFPVTSYPPSGAHAHQRSVCFLFFLPQRGRIPAPSPGCRAPRRGVSRSPGSEKKRKEGRGRWSTRPSTPRPAPCCRKESLSRSPDFPDPRLTSRTRKAKAERSHVRMHARYMAEGCIRLPPNG